MTSEQAGRDQEPPIGWLLPWVERVASGGSALDLGAGDGEAALWLARRGLSVLAVESDGEAAAALRQLADLEANLEALESDLMALPLPAARYDLILASAVLHFLLPSELWALADRLQGALRPGGLLMAEVLTVDDPAFAWYRREGRRQVEPNTYRLEGREGWIHFFEPGELAKIFADLRALHQEHSRRVAPDSQDGYRAGSLLIAWRPEDAEAEDSASRGR